MSESSTALSRIDASEKIMALCQSGELSLKFIQDMGKTLAQSRMLKLKNDQQGAAVVFAAICEGTTPFQLIREFHVMDDGGMTMKADAMLAKFNAAGGKHKWIKDGDDGTDAVLRLAWNGETTDVRYSIEMAEQAGLVKDKGAWKKNPGEMLRARATSKGVRMVCPGIVAGIYCPEDFPEGDERTADAPIATTAKRGRPSKSATPGDAIDVQPEPASPPLPFESDSAKPTAESYQKTAVQLDIEAACEKLGKTADELIASLHAKNAAINSLDDLTPDQAQRVFDNLRAAIAKRQ